MAQHREISKIFWIKFRKFWQQYIDIGWYRILQGVPKVSTQKWTLTLFNKMSFYLLYNILYMIAISL